MEHIEHYQDHKINAWTEERTDGRIGWNFSIDDETVVSETGRQGSAEKELLQAAVTEARRRVDAWPRAD